MHKPVMLPEVLKTLAPQAHETYIDATFGEGGYSRALLESAPCSVVALDRDPEAAVRAHSFEEAYASRFTFCEGSFGDMKDLVPPSTYDGIVFDLGVSSPQLDEADRGFSFKQEGPLDMRMSKTGLSAADVVNMYEEAEIADILWTYGEERRSRALARAIVEERRESLFTTTLQLATLVRKVVGFERPGFDPATRTFQALRLYVNNELGELEAGLQASEDLLKEGGRLVVVSFHSLEDRITKKFLQERSRKGAQPSRHLPLREDISVRPLTFNVKEKKTLIPQNDEIKDNPRARSARLRWAIRRTQ